MRKFVALFIILIYKGFVFGNDFQEGNEAYNNKDFKTAINLYENCVNQGVANPILFFNLGNAYFKNENLGKAILWYERALRLEPNNEDIIHNLAFANTQIVDKVNNDVFWIEQFFNKILFLFSTRSWAFLSIIFVFLTCFCIAILLIAKQSKMRMFFFFSTITFLILFIISIIIASISYKQTTNNDKIIVTKLSVVVKSTPDSSGTTLFTVHEGIKGIITDKTDKWIEVKFPNDEKGWIESTSAEII